MSDKTLDVVLDPVWYDLPPGDFIKEACDRKGWDEFDLFQALGIDLDRTFQFLRGDLAITPGLAERLSKLTGIEPGLWLHREAKYRAAVARLYDEKVKGDSLARRAYEQGSQQIRDAYKSYDS